MSGKQETEEYDLLEQEAQVVSLRRTGASWEEIAKSVGYANPSGAHKAFQRALKRVIVPKVEEYRAVEIDRLERMTLILWNAAEQGNMLAIDRLLKIAERRAKLLGLDMPIKIQQDITTWEGGESIDRAVRDLAALLTINDADSASESSMAIEASQSATDTAGNELAELADSLGSGMGQDPNGSGVDSLASDTPAQD